MHEELLTDRQTDRQHKQWLTSSAASPPAKQHAAGHQPCPGKKEKREKTKANEIKAQNSQQSDRLFAKGEVFLKFLTKNKKYQEFSFASEVERRDCSEFLFLRHHFALHSKSYF